MDDDQQRLVASTAKVLRGRIGTEGLWIEVVGDSMRPTLVPPAKVLVVGAARPRGGEVWAYVDRHGSIVVHRYLRRHRDGSLAFRGDGVDHEDGWVTPFQLIGRVLRATRSGRESPVSRRFAPVARSFGGAAARRLARLRRVSGCPES